MPQREFGGLWINCLLYADDVVLIAAPEVMPKLLKKAEDHSQSLGYRWNPAKCVVFNCPSDHGGRRMKLYGSPIPKASSFTYLGVPFNTQGKIATDHLIRRNSASAISATRATLLPIGIRSTSFSRLMASRLYATFIRPKFEYGLCICTFLVKQLALLEKAQDQCLGMAFGGHRTSSTTVYKHLVNLPSMKERANILVFKFILRVHFLPEDTLLSLLLRFVQEAPARSRFRWPALVASNPLWSNPALNGGHATTANRIAHFTCAAHVRLCTETYRELNLAAIYQKPKPPVLLSACRPYHCVDPIPYITDERLRS